VFYLGSPFIFIIVIVRVAGFLRRWSCGRWQSEILQYSWFHLFPNWSCSLFIFTSLYLIHNSVPSSALSDWSLRTSRFLFRIIFRRWFDHRFNLRDNVSLWHFIFFQRHRIGFILWFWPDVFVLLNFFDHRDFDRGSRIDYVARFIRRLWRNLHKQMFYKILTIPSQ